MHYQRVPLFRTIEPNGHSCDVETAHWLSLRWRRLAPELCHACPLLAQRTLAARSQEETQIVVL
jgi:hypothetical protein